MCKTHKKLNLKEALPWTRKLEGLSPDQFNNSTWARSNIVNSNERCQKGARASRLTHSFAKN